jgi:hypothetical protein
MRSRNIGFPQTVSARALIGRREDFGFFVHDRSNPGGTVRSAENGRRITFVGAPMTKEVKRGLSLDPVQQPRV